MTKPETKSPDAAGAGGIELSCVMPCLNEEETVAVCVKKALETIRRLGISGEVVVSDNGSTDCSVEIARSLGARVVIQPKKGYGNAYMKGISEARGKYIVMADSDDSYDWTDLERFLAPLREGYDMVMGSRLKGEIKPGAMPWLHRYIGNPVLSGLVRIFFRTRISDSHCGMRSFTKTAYERMGLQTAGMEFASEMVIKACMLGLKIAEIPVTLYPDGRTGRPHLRSFRDGWRHLRFMLMFAPTWLYFIPGFSLMGVGFVILCALLPGPLTIGNWFFDIHFMMLGSLMAILGYQIVTLGFYARVYLYTQHFEYRDEFLEKGFRHFNLERGIAVGMLIFGAGFLVLAYILIKWISRNYGPLYESRAALFGMTLVVIGAQTIFSSFFLSMLGIRESGMIERGAASHKGNGRRQ
ncbi:MAG: glycosyltransferase family 2 protein [Candidatus Aureabacteria bacterium]|nr:glycosyltransferase family 2 protein [Candidatus Auribacterota bacterium]